MRRAAVLALAAAALAGCGSGSETKSQSERAIEPLLAYYDAVAEGNVDKACKQTAGEFTRTCARRTTALTRDVEGRKVLAQNAHTIFDKRKATIRGDLACVTVDMSAFDFVKTGGDWKVLRINRPLGTGKHDCTVGLGR